MAFIYKGLVTGKLRGTLGKELVFRDWAGKTIVAKAPGKREGEPTAKQAETQEKFLLASRYGKAVVKSTDTSLADAYAATLKPRQNVYCRAMQDFMNSPVVKSINTLKYKGTAGDTLAIRAIDDFRVVNVRVEIYAAAGTLLEAGDAVQSDNGIDWVYTATLANGQLAGTKVTAIATDVPGNEGILDVSL